MIIRPETAPPEQGAQSAFSWQSWRLKITVYPISIQAVTK